MIHDFISPTPNPMHQNDATGMTHRTAGQSFEMRREIEKKRSTIGSYETAAKKALIEAHDAAIGGGDARVPKTDYYKDMRQSLGIKTDGTTKRNPYSVDRQGNRATVGGIDSSRSRQSLNAKTGGLAIPKRSPGPTFREPQGRSYNPFA